MKWFDSQNYLLNLELMNQTELITLLRFLHFFTEKMEYQCWTIKDNILIIPSGYLDWDLDCRLAFVHLVGIIENRIEESNIWNGDELPRERIRLPYYDGIEK